MTDYFHQTHLAAKEYSDDEVRQLHYIIGAYEEHIRQLMRQRDVMGKCSHGVHWIQIDNCARCQENFKRIARMDKYRNEKQ